ncbi:recombinase family protein [Halonotius sp. GCM10025705]|uniref:recombinase family protein n=1 Tax=Halonotius sp. GCM10025705 TaxID=3252678 RepID=UPI003623479B
MTRLPNNDPSNQIATTGVPIQAADDLTAVIYARTSSPGQQEGYSIDEQVRQCWQRCSSLGWTVSHIFRDEAVSGSDTDREMFQKMLSRAEAGWFDVIVVWKLDRFSRSLMHAVQLEQELRSWDVGLHSVTEHIDTTTPTGRFNFRNISSASELERDLIKQRTQMGMIGLAANHQWPNDNPPLGYRKCEDATLEIIPAEADLVRTIFDRYLRLRSMPDVATELEAESHPECRQLEWTPHRVGKILKNEIYIGEYTVADVDEYVEEYQIVEKRRFETVTQVRNRFQRARKSVRSEMPRNRKERRVQNVTNQYSEFLETQ